MTKIKTARISGDACTSFELAEESAIKKAFEHLEYMHSVVVVDLSTHKIGVLNIRCRNDYMHLLDGLRCVDRMLQQWGACCDVLFDFEKLTCNNANLDENSWPDNMCGSSFWEFRKALDRIYHASVMDISNFSGQLKLLTAEKTKYRHSSRSKPVKMKPGTVDILGFHLQWMSFEQAEFATSINDDELYVGVVMLTIPDTQNISKSGRIAIPAHCPSSTVSNADNGAALEAILYLEREFNIEVVDYNYSEKLAMEEELSFIKDLNQHVRQLDANIKLFWGKVIDRLKCTIQATNGFSDKIKLMHGFQHKVKLIDNWIT